MSRTYEYTKIEEKWQQIWEKNSLFINDLKDFSQVLPQDKKYLLFAFAYPSGYGLHVGHVESMTALDILARYYRMNQKKVFFPVGWDAFGLPAENYAIKTGIHPEITTKKAIATFTRQIKKLAISFDFGNEIATCHQDYYKWTQWLFIELFKHDLAYKKKGKVNWCPSCQTVLANEQVVDGQCERCDSEVIQKDLEQWFFKITEYQDELLEGLKSVDWPGATKHHQINWIGKKKGINITYQIAETKEELVCFTTRPDTNFGATFIVLAPEHEFVNKIINRQVEGQGEDNKRAAVKAYYDLAMKKTERERQAEGRKKTGVFTGFYAINKLNGKKLPIWVSDFVLAGFGTGAVIGVPGHDKRDFQFAKQFDLEVIRVVAKDGDESPILELDQVQEDDGVMINSSFLNGLEIHQAIEKMMDYLEEKGYGKRVTSYKLRDWLISRQRYWGAPIPIVYDPKGEAHPVKFEHLPWKLPKDVDFKPTGESPLKSSREFKERVEKLYGKGWTPEYDTMDTFVDSSWYFLRYLGAREDNKFTNLSKVNDWLPVDLYLIGPEHIVLHLLYSRFFTKFLRDSGYLKLQSGEPFQKMRHQGMILGLNGKKMSKSKGNVINPDDIINQYGADTLRLYEMFMGPLEADKPWDDRAVAGMSRFLKKVYQVIIDSQERKFDKVTDLSRKLHQTIKKVGEDIEDLKFNTAIASLMELINEIKKDRYGFSKAEKIDFIKVLAPFAPFLAEEMFSKLSPDQSSETFSVHQSTWPVYDKHLIIEQEIIIIVQVNGKKRLELLIDHQAALEQDQVERKIKESQLLDKWLEGKTIKKVIFIKGKIINYVL